MCNASTEGIFDVFFLHFTHPPFTHFWTRLFIFNVHSQWQVRVYTVCVLLYVCVMVAGNIPHCMNCNSIIHRIRSKLKINKFVGQQANVRNRRIEVRDHYGITQLAVSRLILFIFIILSGPKQHSNRINIEWRIRPSTAFFLNFSWPAFYALHVSARPILYFN